MLALGLAGCAPELNWREVRNGQSVGLFPCKPANQTRQVPLAGAPVSMTIYACDVGGVTYALASADVADAGRVEGALQEMRGAASRNLAAVAPATESAARVPGMALNAHAVRLRLQGQRPDGTAVREELVLFARGTRVYQAMMIGPRLGAESVETFFGALRAGVS